MNNFTPGASAKLNLFEQFLISEGDVSLREFYNLIFQKFFDRCDFNDFEHYSTAFKLTKPHRGGNFELCVQTEAERSAEHPNQKDRNIFYHILYETEALLHGKKFPKILTFGVHPDAANNLEKRLRKLSTVSAVVIADFTDEGGSRKTRKSEALRLIKAYEIAQSYEDNLCKIKIECAEWVARGFEEHILDSGIFHLVMGSGALKTQQIVLA